MQVDRIFNSRLESLGAGGKTDIDTLIVSWENKPEHRIEAEEREHAESCVKTPMYRHFN
jgi:hypothetical protein